MLYQTIKHFEYPSHGNRKVTGQIFQSSSCVSWLHFHYGFHFVMTQVSPQFREREMGFVSSFYIPSDDDSNGNRKK